MIRWAAISALALMSAGGVAASEPQSRDSSREAAEEEKKICKTARAVGNRAKRLRTCMTQRQWDRLADGTRRAVVEYIEIVGRAPW